MWEGLLDHSVPEAREPKHVEERVPGHRAACRWRPGPMLLRPAEHRTARNLGVDMQEQSELISGGSHEGRPPQN